MERREEEEGKREKREQREDKKGNEGGERERREERGRRKKRGSLLELNRTSRRFLLLICFSLSFSNSSFFKVTLLLQF